MHFGVCVCTHAHIDIYGISYYILLHLAMSSRQVRKLRQLRDGGSVEEEVPMRDAKIREAQQDVNGVLKGRGAQRS